MLAKLKVGKTQIINLFVNIYFETELVNILTAQTLFKTKEFIEYPEKSIKLNFWDIAGQEEYKDDLVPVFYVNVNIIILVHDISNKESFEDIKNTLYQKIVEKKNNYFSSNLVRNNYILLISKLK